MVKAIVLYESMTKASVTNAPPAKPQTTKAPDDKSLGRQKPQPTEAPNDLI